jgi:hypothetical protein
MRTRELKTRHRRLWNWLAKTGSCDKWVWPEWEENGGKIKMVENACFSCQLAYLEYNIECPIPWTGKKEICTVQCEDSGTLYKKWFESGSVTERKKLAKKIADLWK